MLGPKSNLKIAYRMLILQHTSMSNPIQCTPISIPFVTGSTFPTLSKTIFTVQIKIFQRQYIEKKWPRTLKYFPIHVLLYSIRSLMGYNIKQLLLNTFIFFNSTTSINRCRLNSSSGTISVFNVLMIYSSNVCNYYLLYLIVHRSNGRSNAWNRSPKAMEYIASFFSTWSKMLHRSSLQTSRKRAFRKVFF